MLGHAQDYGGKRLTRMSRFVQEALGLPAPGKGARGATALESIARHAHVPEPSAVATPPLAADQRLDLSHARIEDYLECPLRYHYAHRARVPLPAEPQIMYGSAMHHAIHVFHEHRLRGRPISTEDVIAAFDGAWSGEGFHNPEHEQRRHAEGHAALRRFVEQELATDRVPLAVETEFEFRTGYDHVVGRWDRIDQRSEGIVLVDYKSSEVVDADKAQDRARQSARDGQLGLYALAYVEVRDVRPARVELHFVGSGLVGSVEVDDQHLSRARERITRAAQGIRAGDFEATPSSRTCARCSFARFCPQRADP